MAHVSARKGVCPRVIVSDRRRRRSSRTGHPAGTSCGCSAGFPGRRLAPCLIIRRRCWRTWAGASERSIARWPRSIIPRSIASSTGTSRTGSRWSGTMRPPIAGEALRQQLEGWTIDIARHLDPRLPDLRRSAGAQRCQRSQRDCRRRGRRVVASPADCRDHRLRRHRAQLRRRRSGHRDRVCGARQAGSARRRGRHRSRVPRRVAAEGTRDRGVVRPGPPAAVHERRAGRAPARCSVRTTRIWASVRDRSPVPCPR